MKRIILFLSLLAAASFGVLRAEVYTISCIAADGYVGLGSQHGATPYIFYVGASEVSEDGYWEVTEAANGTTFRNQATGQYLAFTTERNGNIVKYMTLSSSAASDNELWTLEAQTDGTFVIRSVADPSYVWDLRRDGSNLLGCYQGNGNGTNERFVLTLVATPREQLESYIATNLPEGVTDALFPTGTDEGEYTARSVQALRDAYAAAMQLLASGDASADYASALAALRAAYDGLVINTSQTAFPPAWHVYLSDGRVEAFPVKYVEEQSVADGLLTISTNVGFTAQYPTWQVDSVSLVAPAMPNFRTFKVNNKYNYQVFTDAQGEIYDDYVAINVAGIGKSLTPSFTFTSPRAAAYVGGVEQTNHASRHRFADEVVYLVADHGTRILQRHKTSSGNYEYGMQPYGRYVAVSVDWLTDRATKVPAVYIETADGQIVTSKTEYKDAFIHIDGAGVFPDFPLTAVQIKGRGNTSWSAPYNGSNPKNPYRLKFAEKQKPFGMTKGKSWVLLANKIGNSMLTNAIGQRIAGFFQAQGANHIIPVDLYINNSYRGSYNFTEKVGFANNSIDLDDETRATFLELDSYFDETYKFRSAYFNLPVNIKSPDFSDPEELTLTTKDAIENRFNRMQEAVFEGRDFSDEIAIEPLCRYLAANELMKNNELAHPKSTFLYNENVDDPTSKFVFGPVWDCDWAYGYGNSRNYFIIEDTSDFYESLADGYVGTNFFRALREREDILGAWYYKVWTDFMQTDLEELIDFVQDYYDYARPSLERNALLWSDGRNYATVAANAQQWLRTRANTVYDRLTRFDTSALEPSTVVPGDVNEDGVASLADAVCLVNAILERENDKFVFDQADLDRNELLTVGDLALLMKLVLSSDNTMRTRRYRAPLADGLLALSDGVVAKDGEAQMSLRLQLDTPSYTALHFTLRLPKGVSLSELVLPAAVNAHHSDIVALSDGAYRIFLYSDTNEPLPAGETTFALRLAVPPAYDAAASVSITGAYAVSTEGEDQHLDTSSAALIPNLTAISAPAESAKETQCFDLQGRRVSSVEKGVFIVNGKKVIK